MVCAVLIAFALLASLPANGQDISLADLARKTRQEKGSAATKRVLTNDEVGAVVDPLVTTAETAKNSLDDYLLQLDAERDTVAGITKDANELDGLDAGTLAQIVLRSKNLDIVFPSRKEWEVRLFKAKESYVASLRAAGKAMEQYHELRDILRNQKINRTQGDEMKLEGLRKTFIDSTDKLTRLSYELRNVSEDGLVRAREWLAE